MKRYLPLLLLCCSASATTTVDSSAIQVTNTQAMIPVSTDQAGNCTYIISEASGLSPVVNDVNTALFAGSNSDARAGSIINGNIHQFIVGTRKGDVALDNRVYSRALAASTNHYGTVTCGSDSAVEFRFSTTQIQVGDSYGEPLPYVSGAIGNYGEPYVDFTDLTKWYVDPQTGYKFRVITGPGQMISKFVVYCGVTGGSGCGGNGSGGTTAAVASGTNWASPSNAFSTSLFATYTTPGQDALTLRLEGVGLGGPFHVGWSNQIGGTGGGDTALSIDSYQVSLQCSNSSGSAQLIDLALSFNGGVTWTDWQPSAGTSCPSSVGAVIYPATRAVGFTGWQSAAYPLLPAVGLQVIEQDKTVTVAGSVVTIPNNDAPWFPLDKRIFDAGSKITISGTEYPVASVDSATQITVTGSPTAGTAAWSGISVRVRKHSAWAGTLSIGSLKLTAGLSGSPTSGPSGFHTHCSPNTSTDSGGIRGRFCLWPVPALGAAGIYWLEDTGIARFIGRGALLASSGLGGGDDYGFSKYGSYQTWDGADANSWWVAGGLVSTGKTTLIKVTYNPAGGSCTNSGGSVVPADYQVLPPNLTSYDPASTDNCHLTATELTRPSLGLDIVTQLTAFCSGHSIPTLVCPTSAKYPDGVGFSFTQNGVAFMTAQTQQDAEQWTVLINLTSGAVTGVFSSYMNQANGSCRGCVAHATVPGGTGNYIGIATNTYSDSSTNTGQGPYYLGVSTTLSATPSISTSTCAASVSDPSVAGLVQYLDGCDIVNLVGSDGVPCDPDPSTWESANNPACTWTLTPSAQTYGVLNVTSSARQWQAGISKIGDLFWDPGQGFELMIILAQSSGPVSNVLIGRNLHIPYGPSLIQNSGIIGSYLRTHTAPWALSVRCNFPGNYVFPTSEVTGTGILSDHTLIGAGHLVLVNGQVVAADNFPLGSGPSGQAVRTVGSYPSSANTPQTNTVLNGGAFAGVAGIGGTGGAVQAHPGYRGSVDNYYTDMAPFAPGSGGSFALWQYSPAPTNVSGNIYKITAAAISGSTGHALDRRLGTAAWSGLYNMQDVSGTSIVGSTAYSYCVIRYTGDTCGQSGAGEAVGDVFVDIPQASRTNVSGFSFDINTLNVTALGQEPLAALQYFFYHLPPWSCNGGTTSNACSGSAPNLNQYERTVARFLARYDAQDTYSTLKAITNSNLQIGVCATPGLQRLQELCVGPVLPETIDSAARYDFAKIPVSIPAGATNAEIRFGYLENGTATQWYCTTAQDACNTSAPSSRPFNYSGETRTLTTCSSGCTIPVPALHGRMLYYSVWRAPDSTTWTQDTAIGTVVMAVR